MAAEDLNQQILEAINALNSMTAASYASAEASKKEAEERAKSAKIEADTSKAIAQQKEKAAKAEAEAQKQLNAKLDLASAALGGAINAIGSYTKAVYKGELGAKAFSQSADDLSNAAKQAAVALAVLTPGGPLMKGLVLALGFIASKFFEAGKEVNEQTGKIYDAFQELARAGANAGGGMQDVFDGLMKMGVGLEKFPEVSKILEENAAQLSTFAGTLGDGRHSLENMVQGMRGMRTDFQMLGIDRTKLIDVSAQYIRVQGTLTRQTKENMDVSGEAVMKYVKETDLLTRITGMSRKKQEEVMEKAMSEEIFGSFIDEMTDQGNQAAAKNLQTFNQLVTSKIGPQIAQGFRDSMIAPGSEAAQQFLMAAGPAGQEIIQQLQQSGKELNAKELGALMNKLAKEIDTTNKSFRPLRAIGGDVAKSFGPGSEARNAAKVLGQDLEKVGEIATKQQEKDLEGDEATRKMAETINAQQDEQIALQKTVNLGMKTSIDVMYKTAEANKVLAEKAYAAAVALGKLAGDESTKAQNEKSRTAAGVAGTMVGGAIVGGAGGEGDAAAIMAAAAEGGGSAPSAPGAVSSGGATGAAVSGGGATGGAGVVGGASSSIGAGAPGAVPPKPEQAPQLAAIRELIAKVESNGNYNVLVGGQTANLTDMTIAEVMKLQKSLIGQNKGSAAGKYQVIYSTLAEAVGKIGLSYDQKFDAKTQDTIADFLIMRRGFNQYAAKPTQEGKERFLASIAAEWAGLPAGPDNKSRYAGVGNNKAGIAWTDALQMFADGGTLGDGLAGIAGERGAELITGPADITPMNDLMRELSSLNETSSVMLMTLRDIARKQGETADASKRLLQVAQN